MNRFSQFILFFISISISVFAQNGKPKDYLNADFHKERRAQLRKIMPKNSVAVFFANPIRNRANDVDFIYHQDPNFFYLTGYKEPHSVLLIFSEPQIIEGKPADDLIYVQSKNPRMELYNGERLGVEGTKQKLGFKNVYFGEEFEKLPIDLSKFDKILYKEFFGDVRNVGYEKANLFSLINQFKIKIESLSMSSSEDLDGQKQLNTKIDIKTLDRLMGSLREEKTTEELVLLKKAVEISCYGQIEVMKAIKPQMTEMEIQGIHEFVFRKYGAEYEGYPSIVGAGKNGCVLHYIDNNNLITGNELVLMDLGAEYHGYTADVTRTIPANGKFSKEQKLIYDLVYQAQEAGIKAAVVGSNPKKIDAAAREVINKGLLELRIIDSLSQGRKYFPHGTSHHIGLDVHDLNSRTDLKENMIITVEPGIYIPEGSACDKRWWRIGVRIEDDILITGNGPVNFSELAPRKSEEIEKMMLEKSIFDNFELPELK